MENDHFGGKDGQTIYIIKLVLLLLVKKEQKLIIIVTKFAKCRFRFYILEKKYKIENELKLALLVKEIKIHVYMSHVTRKTTFHIR